MRSQITQKSQLPKCVSKSLRSELSVIVYILHGLTNVIQVADENHFLKCSALLLPQQVDMKT